jgi:hypothetical protein
MRVTIKSKDGYNVDVTSIYLKALQKQITPEEYKNQLDTIVNTNKNI